MYPQLTNGPGDPTNGPGDPTNGPGDPTNGPGDPVENQKIYEPRSKWWSGDQFSKGSKMLQDDQQLQNDR